VIVDVNEDIMFKVLLIALTLTISGCMINPLTILYTIKVIVDKNGKVLNVVRELP